MNARPSIAKRWQLALLARYQILRSKVLLRVLSKKQQQTLTNRCYERQQDNGGPAKFTRKLFDWEKDFLQSIPNRNIKVLVLGAGDGREISWMQKHRNKWELTALEPSPRFCQKLSRLGIKPLQKSVQELCLSDHSSFDLIYFGWGAFSHILEFNVASKLMADIKAHAPLAQIFVSFMPGQKTGLVFFMKHCGFVRFWSKLELETLAKMHGYNIGIKTLPYPHAFLT